MMRTGIGVGIGMMLAVMLWRNSPTFGAQYPSAFVVVLLLVMFVCWSAGRFWRLRDHERGVAQAAAFAAAEVRAELKANARSNAQAAAVVNVHQQGPDLVTPEMVVAQWSDTDEELDYEIAAHYANEMNRDALKARAAPRLPHPAERSEMPESEPRVLYLPTSNHLP